MSGAIQITFIETNEQLLIEGCDNDLEVDTQCGEPNILSLGNTEYCGEFISTYDAGPQGPPGPNILDLTNLEEGQTLVYDTATGKYEPTNKVDLPAGSVMPVSGAVVIDRNNGEYQRIQLTGNITLTIINWPAAGQEGRVVLEVQNTGSFTINSWPSGVMWPGGNIPTVSGGFGARDIFVFMTFDGGATIYGNAAGQNYH